MKLSAPIFRLKHSARQMSRKARIPLHEALNRIAAREGFGSWSLLAHQVSEAMPHQDLFNKLRQGDLVLVGSRPGHGKTQLSLKFAAEAMKAGHRAILFSLECTEQDVHECFRTIGARPQIFNGRFTFDASANVSASHIAGQLAGCRPGTLAVVDYLQLMDQKREHPELMLQIRGLKEFAEQSGAILVFISQIDRSYDPAKKPFPDLRDVRLPNPLDLNLFSKTIFLNNGRVNFQLPGAASPASMSN